jgi:sulfur carrier protein
VRATINGVERDVCEGTTLADLLDDLGAPCGGLAVAVNERIVRKSALADVTLREGDSIEIVRAVAGG